MGNVEESRDFKDSVFWLVGMIGIANPADYRGCQRWIEALPQSGQIKSVVFN